MWNMFKVNNKFVIFIILNLSTYLTPCSIVSIVNFEHVKPAGVLRKIICLDHLYTTAEMKKVLMRLFMALRFFSVKDSFWFINCLLKAKFVKNIILAEIDESIDSEWKSIIESLSYQWKPIISFIVDLKLHVVWSWFMSRGLWSQNTH